MPHPMSKSAFSGHSKALNKAAAAVAGSSMQQAAAEVREVAGVGEDVLDTTVTFDGTWMRRGHNSLYGVFIVMSRDTGRVFVRLSGFLEVLPPVCFVEEEEGKRRSL